jgi:WD40 repeat protein
VILWDVETSSQRRVLCRQKYPVIAVAFTADGKRIATAGRRVQLWDVEHGNQVWGLSDRESYFSIAFSPDQKSLAYGTNGLIRLCDVASAEPTGKLLAEKGMVYQLDYSPNGKWLAAATSDGTLTLWDTTQQSRRKWVAADQSALFSATFSSDGKYLASGGRERVIRIWTVPALELVDEFYGADETILSVKLSPDAQHLASGTYDGTIQYWDLETPLSSTEVSNTDQPAIPAPQSP